MKSNQTDAIMDELADPSDPELHVIWKPLPGSQTRFLTCPVFEALLEGTRGGGKTDALLMSFAQYCGRGFGEHWRGVLFRLTYPQLADVVAKSKRWFYSIFPGAKFNESEYRWTWPTGEILYFRYGATEDDYWNYHGHEYCVSVDTPVLTPEGWRRMDSLCVGDRVVTLNGIRPVTKIFEPSIKDCVKAYVFDASRNLTGVQVQSAEHRFLTAAQKPCSSTCVLSHMNSHDHQYASSWLSYNALRDQRQKTPVDAVWSADAKNSVQASRKKHPVSGPFQPLSGLNTLFISPSDQDRPRAQEYTQYECHDKWQESSPDSHQKSKEAHPDSRQPVDPCRSYRHSVIGNAPSCDHFRKDTVSKSQSGYHDFSRFCDTPCKTPVKDPLGEVPSHEKVEGPIHVYLHKNEKDVQQNTPCVCAGLIFDHPYTGQSVKAERLVEEGIVILEPCGPRLTMDITVESGNHYITGTGLINKNCWIGFEELTNWKDLSFFEAMFSTCRSSYPGMPRMIRATCNPFGVGHGAVKVRYRIGEISAGNVIREEGQQPRVRIHSSIYENEHLLKNDPNYLPTLEAISDPNRKKAWLLGDWDIHVGSFLEGVWDASKHIIDPFPIPSSWTVWKSMDWGYSAPYAVYWFAMDSDGCIYLWRELYGAGEKAGHGTREGAADVARKIRRIEEHDDRLGYEYRLNLADPSIFSKNGTDRSIGQIFRDNGVKWMEAWNAKGSRVNGAQEIIRLLAENKLKIFRTCKHWLRTVPGLPPDDLNPEDVDTTVEDHAWDATRYGVMRRRRSPDMPKNNEELDGLENGADIGDDGQHRINV